MTDFDHESALISAEDLFNQKEYDKAMELFARAAYALICSSEFDAKMEKVMDQAVQCYTSLNPTFLSDPLLDSIEQYFVAVRHWMDYRRPDPSALSQELTRWIDYPPVDADRDELPAGETHAYPTHTERFAAAVALGQGVRTEMEDAISIQHFTLPGPSLTHIDLFCVFDGHGGKTCAQFTAEELPKALKYQLGRQLTLTDENIYEAIIKACVSVDELWKHLPLQEEGWKDISGSTAAIAMYVNQKELWVANVGDSGTVIELGGKMMQLSEAAKPTNPTYCQEIYMRGGAVYHGRVDGTLDMARSIGDLFHPSVSARPTIKKIEIAAEEHSLIVACDGLWDVMEGQTAVDSIKGKSPLEAAELLRTLAYQRGSSDNVSIIVAQPITPDQQFGV